ncbi:MAG: hypothetical protein K0R66_1701 [Gammaproteobacteria bacterium]|jgi:hypothetical protein|nr:hypothetical protein [Gammaproteobacteria bacterium]
MKNFVLIGLLSAVMSCAWAATPTTNNNTASNGFDQAADTIGVGTQTFAPHLSSSHIKSPPNDNVDDVLQNGISNPDPNSPNNVTSSTS